jgi:hypothetical protein
MRFLNKQGAKICNSKKELYTDTEQLAQHFPTQSFSLFQPRRWGNVTSFHLNIELF